MLCDDLEGWEEGSGERGYTHTHTHTHMHTHTQLIHVVWQKATQHCKGIILQLKINSKRRKKKTNKQKFSLNYRVGCPGPLQRLKRCWLSDWFSCLHGMAKARNPNLFF